MCSIKMTPGTRQLDLEFRSWGGRRRGAGRKRAPGARKSVSHRPRAPHEPRYPVHVTLRATVGLPSLRGERCVAALRRALAMASTSSFRVLHFSIQADHVHLLVESDDMAGFPRAVQGLSIRTAKALNRTLGRRGRVWDDRFHARDLTTPREVRHALVYVLNNFRKHMPRVRGTDPCSSAKWFAGWKESVPENVAVSPLSIPRTWLASVGWLRHGRIGIDEFTRQPALACISERRVQRPAIRAGASMLATSRVQARQ
jgi:putative transposase